MNRVHNLGVLAFSLVAVILLFAACESRQMGGDGVPGAASPPGSISDKLTELNRMEPPPGVDSALWEELKESLAQALEQNYLAGSRVRRIVSTPPTGVANQIDDFNFTDNEGTFTFTWHYRNLGDYDQNGTVAVADLTPLAQHFGETYDAEAEPDCLQAVIDGSGNGEVDIADVTAIAVGYMAEVHHYRIESAEDGEDFTPVQDVPLETGVGEGRKSFTVDLSLAGGFWVRVVPVDSEGEAGDPSDPVQLPIAENQAPVAALEADPTEGEVPLQVEFDASGSSDPDGDIVLYEWDWETDGTWDEDSGEVPVSSHTYDAEGDYTATVRVMDDGGLTDTASVNISVTGVLPNQPPEAALSASPSSGEPPLFVEFDASGSSDSDGSIVLYEWDWESDGTWDEDSGASPTASHEYPDAGEYSATVRVTDNEGATDTADTAISVIAAEWVHSWGGAGTDYGSAVCTDVSGNSFVTGPTGSYGAGWDDVVLLKYSPGGTLLWQKAWGGADSDWGAAIATDASGNIYIAGGTYSFGAGNSDAVLLKYSASGELLLQKTWGGDGVEWATAIAVDASGNVYVAGETYSFGAGNSDVFILKYSSASNLVWQKTWGGAQSESASALAVDTSGDVYLAGATTLAGAGLFDVVLLKLSPDGNIQWKRAWGGSNSDFGYALALDANGDIYVAGETFNFGAEDWDSVLLKFTSSGSLIWQRMWGGSDHDAARAVTLDASGSVFVAGDTESFGLGDYDIVLLEYSAAGDLLRQETWGKSRADQVTSARLVGEKLFLAGKSPNPIGGWREATGTTRTPTATTTTPGGATTTPAGSEATCSGEENLLDGVVDGGGGGGPDVLVYKLDLSLW